MIKILHTADWHVGRTFGIFDEEDSRKLARDRLTVVDRIIGLADQFEVDAILCAGDLFDEPDPGEQWWSVLADRLIEAANPKRPIILLPGNHDPLVSDSVYAASHQFRARLPDSIHVVDDSDFELPIGKSAVVYGSPCTSKAGDRDLAMALPERLSGDERIRIGMVHGSTFEMEGSSTNFPISSQAPAKRGLDYLAIGDTHSFQEIPNESHAPIIYPGTPEPTSFKEPEAGFVALVTFRRQGHRPRVRQEHVARWKWREETIDSMGRLHHLAAENLKSTVLRLKLNLTVNVHELSEVERIVSALKGTDAIAPRTGAFICDRSRLNVSVNDFSVGDFQLPPTITATIDRLKSEANENPEAKRALLVLNRLIQKSVEVG